VTRPWTWGVPLAMGALAACAPPLSPAAQQVRIVAVRPRDCVDLGLLYGGSGDGVDHSEPPDPSQRSWHDPMRSEAADRGANYVWMVRDELNLTAEGRAFRCDTAPTAPPNLNADPTASAATTDSPGPEARLRKLKGLFDKGLITKDEYDKQRAVILQSL
jgi:hypothetical protein